MQLSHFTYEGREYEVCHRSSDVLEVRREVAVRQAMQPHARRLRIKGDLFYDICRAFRAVLRG